MTRFWSCELPATDGPGPQLAALRAIRKSAEIWLPEIVRFALAIEASTLVASRPTAELWSVPAASATAPPVRLLGMSPTRSAAPTPPPAAGRSPVAARMVVPVAGTVTCAPVALPPKLNAAALLGQTDKPRQVTSTLMTVARQDHCSLIDPPCGFAAGGARLGGRME